ncbi:MKI67 FHA domain-interacting nucleolar phosphoprotein-like [Acanthaster planci]|uniref:MKI67 FHA domain-interacting nucleolar phosphoprotein-like n=1 Tax=Acanthaster planci TaxID=133434 RepID=A0A8B7Z4E8_ACAPL|nr:MKI67 FHA domain-interacting nucleolar phosphoprotein-like [Acanthaster planci]
MQGKKTNLRKMADDSEVSADRDEKGVVYLSHIPHGFYEPQMKHFFQQFGKVTRLKLWRSKKSGKSRGFAYVEFEYADVAKIVADTMNNYLMYRKLLKCKFIPKEEVRPGSFSNSHRPFVKPYHRNLSVKRHNSLLTADEARIVKTQQRLVQKEGRRRKKMEKLGIECKLPGYAEEWKSIKKARAIIQEEKRVEALRLKEIEQRKQEALKRAKRKAKQLSLKRKIGKRRRRREAREEAEAKKLPQSSAEEKSPEGGDISEVSPKRKSQDSAASSSSEPDGQPQKKKGRLSTPLSLAKEVATSSSPIQKKKEDKSATLSQRRKSSRLSLRREGKPVASLADKSKLATPKETKASVKSTTATPKTAGKSQAKDSSAAPQACTESHEKLNSPANDRKLRSETKTPRSGRNMKAWETEPSTDEFESSDTTEEEAKVKEFTGIQLSVSEKAAVDTKERGKFQEGISFDGDQLVIF